MVLSRIAANFAPIMQQRLANLVANGPDQVSAEEALSAIPGAEIENLLNLLDSDVSEAAAKIDHAEELIRVTQACKGRGQECARRPGGSLMYRRHAASAAASSH